MTSNNKSKGSFPASTEVAESDKHAPTPAEDDEVEKEQHDLERDNASNQIEKRY